MKRLRVYAFLIAVFLFAILLVSCAVPAYASLSWNVQTVYVYAGDASCPLVVDSNGITHIAYSVSYDAFVVYASWNGSEWSNQTLSAGQVDGLALDVYGNPHLLYSDGLALVYASYQTGTGWQIENTGFHTLYGALALDSEGNPHIAYISGDSLEYASWADGNWTSQTVDSSPEIPLIENGIVDLAIGPNNTPIILYTYGNFQAGFGLPFSSVKLATCENLTWNIQSIPVKMWAFSNLVLDSNGNPHFTCQTVGTSANNAYNDTVLYVSWNGTAWENSVVASGVNLTSLGSLSLDSYNNPSVCYVTAAENGGTNLYYASWTGNSWNTQTLNLSYIASGPSLALDANGNPRISFYQEAGDTWNVMYATATEQTPSSAVPETSWLMVLPLLLSVFYAAIIVRHRKTANLKQ